MLTSVTKTGKRAKHIARIQHFVATSYVYHRQNDSFLLILHQKLGKWLSPGGHLEANEQPHEGALRELREETGLHGQIVNLLPTPQVETPSTPQLPTPFCVLAETIPASPKEDEHIHIDFVYVVEVTEAAELHLQTDEVIHGRWFSSAEIANLDAPENVKQVCHAISQLSKG